MKDKIEKIYGISFKFNNYKLYQLINLKILKVILKRKQIVIYISINGSINMETLISQFKLLRNFSRLNFNYEYF